MTLQVLGQTVLGFRLSIAQILVCLAVGALIEFVVGFFNDKVIMWPASGLLTGNSTAFILRVPGTLHGSWWSLHGVWIFIGVVAISMASKYLIRWKGRHIFNPSNLGLVIAFVALGPRFTEPQDLWWIPMGPWMIVTYAILIGGGLWIGWELKLLGLEIGYMAAFAAFVALALVPVPDHCMIASWHVTPLCGWDLWQVLVTSPEVLIFALFMVPDPRTVPDGQAARFVFGVIVALLSVLLLGPTTLEFWTKTAILASLVIACAGRFGLARLMAPFDEGDGPLIAIGRLGWRGPAAIVAAAILVGLLPTAADLATHGTVPAAELSDGSTPRVTLVVGSGPAPAGWVTSVAGAALPGTSGSLPVAASARVWVLPPFPSPSIAANVASFDSSLPQQAANKMAHDAVLDLIIESEARRAHDLTLAATAAGGDALTEFTQVIQGDISAGKIIQKTYRFDRITVTLWLPKFATQASRLEGLTLHGTATLITRNAAGAVVSQSTTSYDKTWGLGGSKDPQGPELLVTDYTLQNLAPAP
jgi:Na+-translocating ferredoxin:NAD+ oxidoreductase RnfD subunit